MNTYADRLKHAMKAREMDQSALARLVGVKQQSIQYLCREGKRSVHSVKIAEILKISATWLTSGVGEMELSTDDLFIERFKCLSDDKKKVMELMLDQLVQAQPSPAQPSPAQPSPAQLASRTEQNRTEQNIGQKEPSQQPQAQDRRMMTRREPSQFEIDLAIEHERCVMERHEEAMIANARYIDLVKESCKQNECYCDPPCEDKRLQIVSYDDMINRTKQT